MEEEITEKDENGNYKTLGKKRRRNIITVPQSMEKNPKNFQIYKSSYSFHD